MYLDIAHLPFHFSFSGYLSSKAIVVVRHHSRPGEYLRIDGQHRCAAAERAFLSTNRFWKIPVLIFPDDTTRTEMRTVSFYLNSINETKAQMRRTYVMQEMSAMTELGLKQTDIAKYLTDKHSGAKNFKSNRGLVSQYLQCWTKLKESGTDAIYKRLGYAYDDTVNPMSHNMLNKPEWKTNLQHWPAIFDAVEVALKKKPDQNIPSSRCLALLNKYRNRDFLKSQYLEKMENPDMKSVDGLYTDLVNKVDNFHWDGGDDGLPETGHKVELYNEDTLPASFRNLLNRAFRQKTEPSPKRTKADRQQVKEEYLKFCDRQFDVKTGNALHEFKTEFNTSQVTRSGKLKAQVCITDPPWGILGDSDITDPIWTQSDWNAFAEQVCPCVADDGLIFIFATHDMYHAISTALKRFRWHSWDQPLVWVKNGVSELTMRKSLQPHNRHCLIFVFNKKKKFQARINRETELKHNMKYPFHTVIDTYFSKKRRGPGEFRPALTPEGKVVPESTFRVQQKPLNLLRALLRRYALPKNALIIDPCFGTGSLAVAAIVAEGGGLSQKKFFGMDIDPKAHKVAHKWVSNIWSQVKKTQVTRHEGDDSGEHSGGDGDGGEPSDRDDDDGDDSRDRDDDAARGSGDDSQNTTDSQNTGGVMQALLTLSTRTLTWTVTAALTSSPVPGSSTCSHPLLNPLQSPPIKL